MDKGLLTTLQKIKLTSHLKRISDEDFVDRINNFYTPLLLTIFSIVICTKSYIVGEPLQCWVPVHFSKGWELYSESWCYIKNTYYIPRQKEIPTEKALREDAELQYYQWVPFVLGLQAVLFLIPSIFWKFTNWHGRIHIKPIVQRGVKSSYENHEERTKTLEKISEHIYNTLFTKKNINGFKISHSDNKYWGLINSGIYLTFCYMLSKLLYLINIILQLIIVHQFLKADLFFGFKLLSTLANGLDWQVTGLFPRVTLCDFSVPRVGQDINTSMQCVLVINLFNEKIYIFLWFWLVFLLLITIGNFLVWAMRMIFGRQLTAFISKKSENMPNKLQTLQEWDSDTCTDVYLILRIIDTNCGLFTTRKITENLLGYYKKPKVSEKYNSLPPNYHELDKTDNHSSSSVSS